MFAGSIFDLEPATEYECRLVLSDPDGVEGKAENLVTVRTRFEPKPAAGGRVYHVYPADYIGTKQEPAFTGLMAAYYTGSSHSDNFNTYPPRVEPGDTILVHAGLYKDDRFRYGGGGPGGTAPSDGTYYLTLSGTPGRPAASFPVAMTQMVLDVCLPKTELVHSNQDLGHDASSARSPDGKYMTSFARHPVGQPANAMNLW